LWPTAGRALIETAARHGTKVGLAQMIVIAPIGEEATSACLAANGLDPVSSWWVRPL